MIKKIFLLFLICIPILKTLGQNSRGGIGTWREHFNNSSVHQIMVASYLNGSKKIWGSSSQQLFNVDEKNKVTLWGKSNGLNEVGINSIAWDAEQEQLIVAYQNSNIDIIKGDQVYPINDLYLSNIYNQKKIHHITLLHKWALLATDFGIVVIDLLKHEIKDTWFPNNNRQITATSQLAVTQDNLYAVTENGIWSCPLKNDWITAGAWQNLNGYNAFDIQGITAYNNLLYAYNSTSVFQLPLLEPLAKLKNGVIKNIKAFKEGVFVCANYAQKGAVQKINPDKTLTTIIDTTTLTTPLDFIVDQTNYWVADSVNGLLLKNSQQNWIPLGGPIANMEGTMFINRQRLIAPFGNKAKGFSTYDETGWTSKIIVQQKKLPNLVAATIDPIDGSGWMASNNGIVQYNFESTNFNISTPNNLSGDYTAVSFDVDGSLWALQENQGLVQKQNNTWKSYPAPSNLSMSGVKKMTLNKLGQVWIISPFSQGVMVYNPLSTSSKWVTLTPIANNLPSSTVTSMVEDKNGTMWIGTNNGIGLFDCGELNGCKAYLPQIKNNNGFTGLLFQKETVNCIAVDGANRKWVGTNNGTWLLSADANTIIENFNKNNSPIPNDTIQQIVIDPLSGEVFFNTANQMVSYRSTATQGDELASTISIFPNPVSPSYNGPIAIRGLIENAMVKITTLEGRLIYQTRALGGQAIWNGKSKDGNKMASGIYLVFIRDDAGYDKAVGKILITSGG